jgi:DNA-binding transcriptional regulator YhcF (GntR family)
MVDGVYARSRRDRVMAQPVPGSVPVVSPTGATVEVNLGGAIPPVHQEVAARVRGAIRSRTLMPGDVLPSEPTMRRAFAVSRHTLRLGLYLLRGEGLIGARPGHRWVVTENPTDPAARSSPRELGRAVVHLSRM